MRSMVIEDSVFSHNSAPGAGAIGLHAGSLVPVPGPVYTVTMKYCTLYGNEATTDPASANGDGYGGAMLNIKTQLFLQNCIFWGNSAHSVFPATPDIWNASTSTMETWNTDMESLTVNHGSVEEVHHGSFSQDPLFEDPDGADNIAGTVDDNFQLREGSPCIDQADDSVKTDCDLSPAARVVSVPPDVGAYEKFISPSSPTSCSFSVTCAAFPAISPPPVTPPTISPSSTSAKSLPSIFMLLLKK